VARPRSPVIALRNDQMYAEWKSGKNLAWLADKYERTPQQVGRIIAAFHPDLEDEDDRALHRGRLEHLYEEVQGIFDAPGFKMSPHGGPAVGQDGEPAEDVMVKIEAGKLQLQVLESMRKLDARDKPAQQSIRHSHEFYLQQKDDSLAALAARKAADDARIRELEARVASLPPVVQGEVVPELRPVQQRGEAG
jgi:hypothetical protein